MDIKRVPEDDIECQLCKAPSSFRRLFTASSRYRKSLSVDATMAGAVAERVTGAGASAPGVGILGVVLCRENDALCVELDTTVFVIMLSRSSLWRLWTNDSRAASFDYMLKQAILVS